jgi:hypothetical protein
MLYLGKVLDWIGQSDTGRSSITARIGGKEKLRIDRSFSGEEFPSRAARTYR